MLATTLILFLNAAGRIKFSQHSQHVGAHSTGYEIITETYYSDPITLAAGHMIYTNPHHTPLKMPNGTYSIVSFFGDIVDAAHQPVPLSKVDAQH